MWWKVFVLMLSSETHSEVERVCMLAQFLKQPLLQPTVRFPLLRHRREGLTEIRQNDNMGTDNSIQILYFSKSM